MLCKHCKKEEETITIAGKTYCANCSTMLSEKKVEASKLPKHKMPNMDVTENEIRTEKPVNKHEEFEPKVIEMEKNLHVPAKSADELGSSAILLDILSQNAEEKLDEKNIQKNKDLEKASEEVLDALATASPPVKKETPKIHMNDIVSGKISRREDRVAEHSHGIAKKIEEEVKRDVEEMKKPLKNEMGLTREYDILIIFLVVSAILLVLMAILVSLKVI